MSGFFGIFKPRHGAVNPEDFREMETASALKGFDGPYTYLDERQQVAFGHLTLRISPESHLDQQPFFSSCSNYLLTGHFRLDYRDELAAKLNIPLSELGNYSDSKLVMLAWQKWAEQCVHHLYGDWAFAIYDQKEHRLFLAKDQFTGYSALYYMVRNEAVYFSSDVNVLAAITSIKKELDLTQLARVSFKLTHVQDGTTLLKGVFAVKQAHYLVINANLDIRETNYWSLFKAAPILYKHESEYVEHFRHLFQEAVKTRLRTDKGIGVSLSAGFDSSAVAATAAIALQHQQRSLHSFTSVPAFLDKIPGNERFRASEQPAVEEFAKSFPNLITHFEDLAGYSFIDPIIDGSAFNFVAPTINPNIAWVERIFAQASATGIGRILNGQMGNTNISWHLPQYHSGLLMQGRLFKMMQELKALKRTENRSVLNSFKVHVIGDLRKHLVCLVNQLKPIRENVMLRESILSEEVLRNIDWKAMKENIAFLPKYTVSLTSQILRKQMLERADSYAGQGMYARAHKYGMEAADPTADIRLASFSFHIPEELWHKNGVRKFLYKEVFRDIVPAKTMSNQFTFLQAADSGFRQEADLKFLNYINGYIDSTTHSTLLNTDKMREHIRQFNAAANWKEKKLLGSLLLIDISFADFINKCSFGYE